MYRNKIGSFHKLDAIFVIEWFKGHPILKRNKNKKQYKKTLWKWDEKEMKRSDHFN